MATPILTEKDIRLFLMDSPALNTLVLGMKWSPEMVEQAIINVVDRFNMQNPHTAVYSVETFPFRYLLLVGVASHLLKSAALGDAVNQITYNADGVTVDDRDKAQLYMNLAQSYDAEFKEAAQNIKISQNIALVFGHHGSEWSTRYR